MGTATLVDQEIQDGKRLIDALNQAGLSVNSALWLYLPEKETWRLMLTSPIFDKEGSLKTYKEIISVFGKVQPELKINWMNLVAVSPQHKLIQGLRKLQKDWNFNLLGKRLTNNTVNHIYVDDAYIYQIE
ncbi:hypothetical protein BCD67_25310 [Oscillatoriales cyanobacterium USR001]|jgi:hypothetical protein|nr:hypothetical protein BCD67_25310 [Oscillatoriales cyanobacterium USR001]